MERIVVSSAQTSLKNFEWAAVQYVERSARAAAMVAISKRRRFMPSRIVALSAFHACATSGRVENAAA
jgi:hypothetical protein